MRRDDRCLIHSCSPSSWTQLALLVPTWAITKSTWIFIKIQKTKLLFRDGFYCTDSHECKPFDPSREYSQHCDFTPCFMVKLRQTPSRNTNIHWRLVLSSAPPLPTILCAFCSVVFHHFLLDFRKAHWHKRLLKSKCPPTAPIFVLISSSLFRRSENGFDGVASLSDEGFPSVFHTHTLIQSHNKKSLNFLPMNDIQYTHTSVDNERALHYLPHLLLPPTLVHSNQADGWDPCFKSSPGSCDGEVRGSQRGTAPRVHLVLFVCVSAFKSLAKNTPAFIERLVSGSAVEL